MVLSKMAQNHWLNMEMTCIAIQQYKLLNVNSLFSQNIQWCHCQIYSQTKIQMLWDGYFKKNSSVMDKCQHLNQFIDSYKKFIIHYVKKSVSTVHKHSKQNQTHLRKHLLCKFDALIIYSPEYGRAFTCCQRQCLCSISTTLSF